VLVKIPLLKHCKADRRERCIYVWIIVDTSI